MCQVDCFCFSLPESEHEWWAVILSWISKSVFSSNGAFAAPKWKQGWCKYSKCIREFQMTRTANLILYEECWHACKWYFLHFQITPLPMWVDCDSAHSLQHFVCSLHLGKIVSFYTLVKGTTLLVSKYTVCPRMAGITFHLIFKCGASSRGFVHVWKCYYPLEHGLEHICQHFNVKKIFFS